MKVLPAYPDQLHLRKQAKQLLRDARSGDAHALERFAASLPAARGLAGLASHRLKLHDAQSVIAREHGFQSWTELKRFVEWKRAHRSARLKNWLEWVYEGSARERRLALRTLSDEPDFFDGDPWVACAVGDEPAIRKALNGDPAWKDRAGGPLGMPPLVAVTHSLLILEPAFEPKLLACARLLVQHQAGVNCFWVNPKWPDSPLSALYGAAGRTHHVGMLQLLLDAGADPNDNESLYHSTESPDSQCTRLLLEAGARVVGTNAIARVLDFDKLDDLQLMLQRGGDAKERPWIHHAILRGRSLAQIQLLVDAGADLRAADRDGISLYRAAQLHGRLDVVELLHAAGVGEPLSEEDQFVAACARGDDAAARAIRDRIPDIFSRLTEIHLRALPEHADISDLHAVRTMLALGWPREVKAAWDATALNLAVYRGDAQMAELLLQNGADWQTKHGFGGNVLGTLSHASQFNAEDPSAPCEFLSCAQALVEHGVPLPDESYTFSPEVTEYFDALRLAGGSR